MLGNHTAPSVDSRTIAAVQRFNDAFNRHDVPAIMALMTEDCVFENTTPPPDGERFEGQAAVRAVWESLFRDSPHAVITPESFLACGDRCVMRWRYDWIDSRGEPGHVRGVDLFLVRDGRIAEKLSYVKG
jgi:ketosteroid isomerase-like protein